MDSYSKIVNIVNDSVGFASASHIRLTEVRLDHAEAELIVGPDSLNPYGKVHGGCLATLADTTGGAAVRSRGRNCVTLNCALNYLRPAAGKKIRGVGDVVRCGRTVAVCDITLLDDEDRKVATGTFTFFLTDEPLNV